MKFWVYIALAVALLSLTSYRQIVISKATPEERMRCETLVRAYYAEPPAIIARLLAACPRPGMVAMMDARGMGAEPQTADAVLAAVDRHTALSVLINIALLGSAIACLFAARRHRQRRPPHR